MAFKNTIKNLDAKARELAKYPNMVRGYFEHIEKGETGWIEELEVVAAKILRDAGLYGKTAGRSSIPVRKIMSEARDLI